MWCCAIYLNILQAAHLELFSSRRFERSCLVIYAFLVQLMPNQLPSSQQRITNVSLLLSRVLFYAIFALFMFVLFVSISVLTTLKMNISCHCPNNVS